jgi:ubiquinone/menaquinone biosynthesis C-methylase UbiE
MSEYDDATYGDRIADVFDDIMAFPASETNAAVDELFRLSAGGPALELGIGTGRVALPLAQRGIAVYGIDSSRKMIDILRSKAGGQ